MHSHPPRHFQMNRRCSRDCRNLCTQPSCKTCPRRPCSNRLFLKEIVQKPTSIHAAARSALDYLLQLPTVNNSSNKARHFVIRILKSPRCHKSGRFHLIKHGCFLHYRLERSFCPREQARKIQFKSSFLCRRSKYGPIPSDCSEEVPFWDLRYEEEGFHFNGGVILRWRRLQ